MVRDVMLLAEWKGYTVSRAGPEENVDERERVSRGCSTGAERRDSPPEQRAPPSDAPTSNATEDPGSAERPYKQKLKNEGAIVGTAGTGETHWFLDATAVSSLPSLPEDSSSLFLKCAVRRRGPRR